jgi:AraC-like DNA-binding protein
MKPQLLKIQSQPLGSFTVRKEMSANINSRWHYHPEVELIHFRRGTGMQFVGDHMMRFQPGDVVLVGADLPHYWRFDEQRSRKSAAAYSTVIHFLEDFWGDQFNSLPETRRIKGLLDKAKQGILIRGKHADAVARTIERVHDAQGLFRLIALLETLYTFAGAKDQVILSSLGFKYSYSSTEDERMHNVYEYTLKHASDKIQLRKIARVAGLAENSFCRYFKSRTGKTYSRFVTEIRVGQVCKMLIEDKMSIKQICFSSGFNNFSCFFNKFKSVTGKTPRQYKHEIMSGGHPVVR